MGFLLKYLERLFNRDSPASLGGPNQALYAINIMLAALATCAAFTGETAAEGANITF